VRPWATHTAISLLYAAGAVMLGVGLVLWAAWPIVTAAIIATLSLLACVQIHAAITFSRPAKPDKKVTALEYKVAQLEAAHDQNEVALARLAATVEDEMVRRNEAVVTEMKALESAVAQMARTFQTKIEAVRRDPTGANAPRSESALLGAVRAALDENRIDLHLQPIVTLPQRRVAFYEGFTRIRDAAGRVILPGEFLRVAEPNGLVGEIDNLLLFRCVQIVRRLLKQDRRIGVFCNISAASLADEAFFPSFFGYMRENRDLAGAVIFEMSHQAFRDMSPVTARNMGRLFDLGFRFSVDRVESMDLDLRAMERAGVRYVKAAGAVLQRDLVDAGARPQTGLTRDIEPRDVSALFARYGVDLIADRIEEEKTVIGLLELDIGFGQGHLFGAPRPIKEAVYEEPGAPRPTALRMAG
jgi:cyclic-di-GMP phosphodiesterase, flagellum assembly factor TipF